MANGCLFKNHHSPYLSNGLTDRMITKFYVLEPIPDQNFEFLKSKMADARHF